jgi:hypothetical protein
MLFCTLTRLQLNLEVLVLILGQKNSKNSGNIGPENRTENNIFLDMLKQDEKISDFLFQTFLFLISRSNGFFLGCETAKTFFVVGTVQTLSA